MLSIQTLEAISAVKADAIAIESDSGDVTWREMLNSVTHKVEFLVQKFPRGMPRQVCYLSENGPNLVAWLGAFATLEITATGLDHSEDSSTLLGIILRLNPSMLLCSGHLRGLDAVFTGDTGAETVYFDPFTMSDQKERRSLDLSRVEIHPYRSVAVTSGTSGNPKLVLRHESFEKRRFEYFSRRFRLDRRDRFLACLPLHHAAGNGWVRFFMSLGASVVLTDKSDGRTLSDAVYRKGITATVLTPVLLDRIVTSISLVNSGRRPPDLRWVLVGGKNFTPHRKRRCIEALGVVHEYFGTTETGVNTLADPVDLLLHPRSVGRAIPGTELAIVDAAGKVLKAGETGAVAVASYMNMASYDDSPGHEIFISGKRYLVTPDQGYLDEDGRLYLRNRLARPEAGVDLYDLENEILQIGSVRDVILHQNSFQAGDEICGAVASTHLNSGVEAQVRTLVEKRGLRIPTLMTVNDIPYSPTGKVRLGFLESSPAHLRSQP